MVTVIARANAAEAEAMEKERGIEGTQEAQIETDQETASTAAGASVGAGTKTQEEVDMPQGLPIVSQEPSELAYASSPAPAVFIPPPAAD